MIGANIHLSRIADKDFEVIFKLKEGLDGVGETYEFVLIDCLPSFGYLNMAALNVAGWVLIPIQPAPFALAGLKDLFDTISKARKRLNKNLEVLGIVLNLMEGRRTTIEAELEGVLREKYRALVFHSILNKGIKLAESPAFTQSIMEYDPQRITYSHSTMCQTCLPFVKSDEREWKNKNGNSVVVVEAGQVYDPKKKDLVKLGLPYGTKPRLILLDWNRQAVLTQSPTIPVEDTLYAFLKRLHLPTEGRVYGMTKKQLSALAACHMTVGRPTEDGGGETGYGKIVSNLDVLFGKDDQQRVLWPNTVTLSNDYFESLMSHAVPLDEGALFLLKDSALELDLYAMLAERLHRIKPNQPQFVHWAGLWEQYGKGYKQIKNFRAKFRHHLMNVRAVYPDAQIEEVYRKDGMPKGLRLCRSKPPVPPKTIVQNIKKLVEKPVDE